ncbi:MAG: serine hydrolase, partial [Cyanobacteria bacterium Co-bin8]|nr:serine hydrolase [Cyanobacteria bacterium Co-bin8]
MLAVVLIFVLLLLPLPAIAAPTTPNSLARQQPMLPQQSPQQALERLFIEPQIQPGWFAESFLRQVPFAGIQPLLDDLKQTLGELQEIRPGSDGFELQFERGRVRSQIALNAQGQITTLYFASPEIPVALEDAIAAVRSFPGEASLLVLQAERELANVNAEQPLAVGSAFKLAVLAALQGEIEQGRHRWDEVVTLQPGWKSLPSGLLQDWPDGTALTVETLATLMISLSDNTATDALIHTVGRQPIEVLSPHNRPFLTTRDFFALKNPQNALLLSQFRAGDEADRRAL